MRTQAQIEASRANGAKSKGPVTEEGKNRASRNATRHGLLAETVVLKGESIERFHDHLAGFIAEFKPESSLELELVEKMAVFRWRQLSVWGRETLSAPASPLPKSARRAKFWTCSSATTPGSTVSSTAL